MVFIPANRHEEPEVVHAKNLELENWKKMEVVDCVEDRGQRRISTRWVVTEKQHPDGTRRPKTRLVVRGYEECENLQKDAPTASKTSLRVAFGLPTDNNWDIETIDIKAAFLQSQQIKRGVNVTRPKEAQLDKTIWRLRKLVYGLVDAARTWFRSLKDEL